MNRSRRTLTLAWWSAQNSQALVVLRVLCSPKYECIFLTTVNDATAHGVYTFLHAVKYVLRCSSSGEVESGSDRLEPTGAERGREAGA